MTHTIKVEFKVNGILWHCWGQCMGPSFTPYLDWDDFWSTTSSRPEQDGEIPGCVQTFTSLIRNSNVQLFHKYCGVRKDYSQLGNVQLGYIAQCSSVDVKVCSWTKYICQWKQLVACIALVEKNIGRDTQIWQLVALLHWSGKIIDSL